MSYQERDRGRDDIVVAANLAHGHSEFLAEIGEGNFLECAGWLRSQLKAVRTDYLLDHFMQRTGVYYFKYFTDASGREKYQMIPCESDNSLRILELRNAGYSMVRNRQTHAREGEVVKANNDELTRRPRQNQEKERAIDNEQLMLLSLGAVKSGAYHFMRNNLGNLALADIANNPSIQYLRNSHQNAYARGEIGSAEQWAIFYNNAYLRGVMTLQEGAMATMWYMARPYVLDVSRRSGIPGHSDHLNRSVHLAVMTLPRLGLNMNYPAFIDQMKGVNLRGEVDVLLYRPVYRVPSPGRNNDHDYGYDLHYLAIPEMFQKLGFWTTNSVDNRIPAWGGDFVQQYEAARGDYLIMLNNMIDRHTLHYGSGGRYWQRYMQYFFPEDLILRGGGRIKSPESLRAYTLQKQDEHLRLLQQHADEGGSHSRLWREMLERHTTLFELAKVVDGALVQYKQQLESMV